MGAGGADADLEDVADGIHGGVLSTAARGAAAEEAAHGVDVRLVGGKVKEVDAGAEEGALLFGAAGGGVLGVGAAHGGAGGVHEVDAVGLGIPELDEADVGERRLGGV